MNNYILYAENGIERVILWMDQNLLLLWTQKRSSTILKQSIESYSESQTRSILAVDCEMVVTEAGYELARVTCVSGKETVLLDSFAKPEHPVIDYVTKYSGITEEMLKDAPRMMPLFCS